MGAMKANFQSFLHRNHHLCLKIQLKGVAPRLAFLMVNPTLVRQVKVFQKVLIIAFKDYIIIVKKYTTGSLDRVRQWGPRY
jgi:hypothetical protein